MTNNILLLALGLKAAESNASDKSVLIGRWENFFLLERTGISIHFEFVAGTANVTK